MCMCLGWSVVATAHCCVRGCDTVAWGCCYCGGLGTVVDAVAVESR